MLVACVLFLTSVTQGERWYVQRQAGIPSSKTYNGIDTYGFQLVEYKSTDLATCKAECVRRTHCNVLNYGVKGNCCTGKCQLIQLNTIDFGRNNKWKQYLPSPINSDSYWDAYVVLKDYPQAKATPGPEKAMKDLWEDKMKMDRGEDLRDVYEEVSTYLPKIKYVVAGVAFVSVIGLVFQYKKNNLMQVEDDNQYTVVEA